MMLRAYFGFRRWLQRQEGQGMTEYGLIIALVAIAVIVVLGNMGGELKRVFTDIFNQLKSAKPK